MGDRAGKLGLLSSLLLSLLLSVVIGLEPWASRVPGKHSTTKPHCQPFSYFYFEAAHKVA